MEREENLQLVDLGDAVIETRQNGSPSTDSPGVPAQNGL